MWYVKSGVGFPTAQKISGVKQNIFLYRNLGNHFTIEIAQVNFILEYIFDKKE